MNFFYKNKLTLIIIIAFIFAAGYAAEDSDTIIVTSFAPIKKRSIFKFNSA